MSIDKTPWVSVGAEFCRTGEYRYRLHREWLLGEGTVTFVMLNPSTADAQKLDPTIRRCVAFAQAWGFKRLEVVNLFAIRSPKPAVMKKHPEPVGRGRDNDVAILCACREADCVIAAWGIHGSHRDRDRQVRELLKTNGIVVHALHITDDGQPGHPLFLPAASERIPFPL